jgi:hypothetical protein
MPSIRVAEFDTWRPGYGQASVRVLVAGTNDLATIYSDEDLTAEVDNPQTLVERIDPASSISYGKFSQPIYVGVPYELEINSIDFTGVQRPPLTTLEDVDASMALVTVAGGQEAIHLEDHLARRIDVRDFGEFLQVGETGASTATNTATLIAAIGAAGALGGGFVEAPAGTYQFSNVTIPLGVVLRGQGRQATTLQSTTAGQIVVIGGDRAGLSRVTIDGISQVTNSIGLYAENKNEIVLDDVEIKRFATAFQRKGGQNSLWFELFISDCIDGYKAHGDNALGAGGALAFNAWVGGLVELCSGKGIELKNVDLECKNNTFSNVVFDTNTGTAVHIEGARNAAFRDCEWLDNTVNLVIKDGALATDTNTVIGIEVNGGSITGGTMDLRGNLETTAFRRVDLKTITIAVTTPLHNILVEDCREISGVSITGTATAWDRHKTFDRGSSSGITTGNAATKVWAIALAAGQQVYLEAKVVARQRNGTGTAFYHLGVSAGRPGASLNYDTQTVNFTPGAVVTGGTSGATARITNDADSGTTGTLTLQDISGVFLDNEDLRDDQGGVAICNGALSFSNAALVGTVASIRAAQETDATWDATFVANGPEIELRVTGASSKTIEWECDVDTVSS